MFPPSLPPARKDDNPAPVPESGFLERILAGNYWREKIHFVYYRGGTTDPNVYIEKEDIIKSYGFSGGWTYEDQVLLDAIYIDPDKRIYRYIGDNEGYTGYYKNKYTIEYHEDDMSIRI